MKGNDGYMEALIDGKWVKYDLDGRSRNSYADIQKDKEYLGEGFECRYVNKEGEKGKPFQEPCRHIWRWGKPGVIGLLPTSKDALKTLNEKEKELKEKLMKNIIKSKASNKEVIRVLAWCILKFKR